MYFHHCLLEILIKRFYSPPCSETGKFLFILVFFYCLHAILEVYSKTANYGTYTYWCWTAKKYLTPIQHISYNYPIAIKGPEKIQFNSTDFYWVFLTSNIRVNWQLFNHSIPLVSFFMANLIPKCTSFCWYFCPPLLRRSRQADHLLKGTVAWDGFLA